jgi:hypothetical protein
VSTMTSNAADGMSANGTVIVVVARMIIERLG